MAKAVEEVLAAVMALDDQGQARIYQKLREKIEISTDPEYVQAWEAEIRARLKEIDSGDAEMLPWDDALKMIKRDGAGGDQTA